MKNILLFILVFITSTSLAFALSAPENAQYSDDGTHWYSQTGGENWEPTILIIDGVEKARYTNFTNIYFGNILYSIVRDYPVGNDYSISRQYILKDWIIIDSGSTIWSIQDNKNILLGWYVHENGTFRVKDIQGKVLLEDRNASANSSSTYILSGVILSTVANRNWSQYTSYINTIKVPNKFLIFLWVRKKNIYFTDNSTNYMYIFNIKSNKLRKLSPYVWNWQYAITNNSLGDIQEMQYVILIDDKYAIADRDGKIISKERYDSIDSITAYWSNFFRSMKIGEKKYFSFADKVYWPYDQIDTFNPSFGYNPSDTSSVRRWSIFVQKNGKNYIVVNGKEVLIGN